MVDQKDNAGNIIDFLENREWHDIAADFARSGEAGTKTRCDALVRAAVKDGERVETELTVFVQTKFPEGYEWAIEPDEEVDCAEYEVFNALALASMEFGDDYDFEVKTPVRVGNASMELNKGTEKLGVYYTVRVLVYPYTPIDLPREAPTPR